MREIFRDWNPFCGRKGFENDSNGFNKKINNVTRIDQINMTDDIDVQDDQKCVF